MLILGAYKRGRLKERGAVEAWREQAEAVGREMLHGESSISVRP